MIRRAMVLGILVGLVGCGGNAPDAPVAADAAASADAAIDAGTPADACVMAQGNCGCVFEETIHYGADGPQIVTTVVCP